MAWLDDNPPVRRQFRAPRRAKPTGLIVVHSAENLPDVHPPDTSAENVASFIRNRTDPGSYHDLCDSDSPVHLVDYGNEAYQDGTGSNPWALSVSGAFRAAQWREIPLWWRNGCIDQMARAARRQADWLLATHGIHVPPRRISRAMSEQGMAGFISHGERDPDRRSDPGAWFPWEQFLDVFTDLGSPATPTPPPAPIPEDDDMPVIIDTNSGKYLLSGNKIVGIKKEADLAALKAAGIKTTGRISDETRLSLFRGFDVDHGNE